VAIEGFGAGMVGGTLMTFVIKLHRKSDRFGPIG